MTVVDVFAYKLLKLMKICKFELLRFNLRLINHYLIGASRHIAPSISPTLINKIRVTLFLIEGDHILEVRSREAPAVYRLGFGGVRHGDL